MALIFSSSRDFLNISEGNVQALKKEGITITEIIERAGIGRTSFYEIMKGKQIPRIDTAINISKALNADIKDIFPQLKGA